jgi:hypothetical protein
MNLFFFHYREARENLIQTNTQAEQAMHMMQKFFQERGEALNKIRQTEKILDKLQLGYLYKACPDNTVSKNFDVFQ